MLFPAKENQYYQVFLPQDIGLGIGLGLLFLPSSELILLTSSYSNFTDSWSSQCNLASFCKATRAFNGNRHQWILVWWNCLSYYAQQDIWTLWFCMRRTGHGVCRFRQVGVAYVLGYFRESVWSPGFVATLIAGNLLMRTRLPPRSQRPPTPPPDIKAMFRDWAYLFSIAG